MSSAFNPTFGIVRRNRRASRFAGFLLSDFRRPAASVVFVSPGIAGRTCIVFDLIFKEQFGLEATKFVVNELRNDALERHMERRPTELIILETFREINGKTTRTIAKSGREQLRLEIRKEEGSYGYDRFLRKIKEEPSCRRPVFPSLPPFFHKITDPRHKRGIRHPFVGMLALVFLGTLAGMTEIAVIRRWVKNHWKELRVPLGFTRKTPAETTISRALAQYPLIRLLTGDAIFAQRPLIEVLRNHGCGTCRPGVCLRLRKIRSALLRSFFRGTIFVRKAIAQRKRVIVTERKLRTPRQQALT